MLFYYKDIYIYVPKAPSFSTIVLQLCLHVLLNTSFQNDKSSFLTFKNPHFKLLDETSHITFPYLNPSFVLMSSFQVSTPSYAPMSTS